MKRAYLIGALLSLASVVVASQDAFARGRVYHPRAGVFMQRDPMGTAAAPPKARNLSASRFTHRDPTREYARDVSSHGGVTDLGSRLALDKQGDVIHSAYISAMEKTADTFGSHAALRNPHLLQYANGANLYEYMGSSTLSYTDPSGMDRYVCGCPHSYLVVSIWDAKCCKKVGWRRYDYSMKASAASIGGVIGTAWNSAWSISVAGVGQVRSQPWHKPTSWRGGKIESTCKEDNALVQELDDQAKGKKDLYYNLWFYNSNHWAVAHSRHHLDPANDAANESSGDDACTTPKVPEHKMGLCRGCGALCPFVMVDRRVVAEPLAGALGQSNSRDDIVPLGKVSDPNSIAIRNTMAEIDTLDRIRAWALAVRDNEKVVTNATSSKAYAISTIHPYSWKKDVALPADCRGIVIELANTRAACSKYRAAGLKGHAYAEDFVRESQVCVSLTDMDGEVLKQLPVSLVGGAVSKRVFAPLEDVGGLPQNARLRIKGKREYWNVLSVATVGACREIDLDACRPLAVSILVSYRDLASSFGSCDGREISLLPGDEVRLSLKDLRAGEAVILRIHGHYRLLSKAEPSRAPRSGFISSIRPPDGFSPAWWRHGSSTYRVDTPSLPFLGRSGESRVLAGEAGCETTSSERQRGR